MLLNYLVIISTLNSKKLKISLDIFGFLIYNNSGS